MHRVDGQITCPMEVTLGLIGGKWKCLVLLQLSTATLRFNELRRLIPGATQKMLTQQLRQLENDGLIVRTIYAQVPPKVEYALSDFGKSLRPVLDAMCDWGAAYLGSPAVITNRGKPRVPPDSRSR